jgi:6-pyruvoyltetrahydropterin/6-carboxytetrahydropterin synthase
MKLVYTRKFDAAHYLADDKRNDEWNKQTYGKCCNVHGHTWLVEFELEGAVDEETGMLVNFNILKGIIDELDHTTVNLTVDLPTAENLVKYFMDKLKEMCMFDAILVRIWESDHAYAEDSWRTE